MSIRVLIVDDSIAARQSLGRLLGAQPDIEALRPAANGELAIARIACESPDVVILDVEMPVMDGLSALRVIRQSNPKLPVIMFSSLTEAGTSTTIDALASGASDYVAKPSALAGARRTLEQVADELIIKVRALAGPPPDANANPEERAQRRKQAPTQGPRPESIEAVVIGSSTGGPNALAQILPQLPADLPVPLLIVQHMPALFTKHLAERLNRESRVTVFEGRNGCVVRPGEVAIAPGGFHMLTSFDAGQVTIRLTKSEKVQSCRPAVDPLFASAAKSFGNRVLAIVLTGMGQDGHAGTESIYETGGVVIAQDEATSVVWGMPKCIAEAGLADDVLPINLIAERIKATCHSKPPRCHA